MIGLALFVAANKSEATLDGFHGSFDPFECGAALDIAPEKVVAVYQALEKQDWITGDYLATWDKRQPDREDPTAAARQQRRRAKLKAITRDAQVKDTSAPVEAATKPKPRREAQKVGEQYWLPVDHRQGDPGPGRLAIRAMAAEMTIGAWRREAKGDDEAHAAIISAASDEGLMGDNFRNVVGQRIRDLRIAKYPQRPLGMTAIRGGAA